LKHENNIIFTIKVQYYFMELLNCVKNNDINAVIKILNSDTITKEDILKQDDNGIYPLYIACMCDYFEICELLINKLVYLGNLDKNDIFIRIHSECQYCKLDGFDALFACVWASVDNYKILHLLMSTYDITKEDIILREYNNTNILNHIMCSFNKNYDIIKFLIEKYNITKEDINIKYMYYVIMKKKNNELLEYLNEKFQITMEDWKSS